MAEKRITVWVQAFQDRANLMLQWIDPTTNRRKSKSAGTADPKEAEHRRADLESDLSNNRFQEASKLDWPRFRELFTAEYVAAKRMNTQENYEAMFNIFDRVCRPQTLRGVTERTVSLFAAGLRKEPGRAKGSVGQAPSTVRQRLQLLRTALRWAVDQQMLPKLPKFPAVKVPKKKPQPIPTEAFEKLLDKAEDATMRAYLLAGWLGGLRLAEAAALEWQPTDKAPYLDLGRNRIVLPAEIAKAVEDQWVPLDAQLRAALEDLPGRRGRVFRFVNKHNGGAVCLNAVGERVIRLAKKAGVKLTMHFLRRGFGCRYAGKVPAQVLQRLMRHSNIATTMTFYANVDAAVEEAVLGPQRNRLRNTSDDGEKTPSDADAVNPCRETTNGDD